MRTCIVFLKVSFVLAITGVIAVAADTNVDARQKISERFSKIKRSQEQDKSASTNMTVTSPERVAPLNPLDMQQMKEEMSELRNRFPDTSTISGRRFTPEKIEFISQQIAIQTFYTMKRIYNLDESQSKAFREYMYGDCVKQNIRHWETYMDQINSAADKTYADMSKYQEYMQLKVGTAKTSPLYRHQVQKYLESQLPFKQVVEVWKRQQPYLEYGRTSSLDEWDLIVAAHRIRYGLDESQSETAASILREMRERLKSGDTKENLTRELRKGLETIPTAIQRELTAQSAASRPSATSKPAR